MLKALSIAAVVTTAGALPGSATTAETPPTRKRRAACEKMLNEMGESATYTHTSDKTGVVKTMGLTHSQCRTMLRR